MNKILLKTAAAVNIAAAAIIYIACSGDDGKDGKAGSGCTIAPIAGVGATVTCGETSVVIKDGEAGQGGGGVTGCYLRQIAGSTSFSVICNEIEVGQLAPSVGGGCNLSTTPGSAYFTVACPGQDNQRLAKAICNYRDGSTDKSVAYDPDVMLCSTVSPGGGIKGNCDGVGYLVGTQFCAKKAATDLTRGTLARCGATTDAETGEFIKEGTYNPITEFCAQASGFFSSTDIDGATILSGEVKPLCGSSPNPSTTSNKYGSTDGRYTTADFCATNNIVYPICGSSTFNPVNSFCLVANNAADPVLGTSTTGQVTPRCGTSGTNDDGEFYKDDDFCENAKVYPLCKTIVVSAGGTVATLVGTDLGKYTTTSQFCRAQVTSATSANDYTITSGIVSLSDCGTAANNKYNPDKEFCYLATSKVYPKCEGKGTAGIASSGSSSTDYLVTSEFCETRGADIRRAYASSWASATKPFTIIANGGTIYSYKTIGTQTWMAENLKQYASATAVTATGTSGLNWSEATTSNSCPSGWKLPSNADWDALVTAAGGQNAALNLRAVTGASWVATPATTAASGFDAINESATTTNNRDKVLIDVTLTNGQAGPPVVSGGDLYAAWWSATENVVTPGVIANDAYFKAIIDDNISVYTGIFNKLATKIGVRCIKE